jgi:rRNA maturation RNase YbeY
MAITFQAENVTLPKIKKRETANWIKAVAQNHGKNAGNISYLFCTDDKILEVNRQYLQHDYYTDIITFDYSEEGTISGDIFISVDTVRSNSQMYHVTFEEELYRVIIHGILHLCGMSDDSETGKKGMRKAEEDALRLFGLK